MKVYAVIDEYYSYEYTNDSEFQMELFATVEDAKTYFECLKEECLDFYKGTFDCKTTDELVNEVFEDFDESDEHLYFEIYDECSKFMHIKEYNVMSFK